MLVGSGDSHACPAATYPRSHSPHPLQVQPLPAGRLLGHQCWGSQAFHRPHLRQMPHWPRKACDLPGLTWYQDWWSPPCPMVMGHVGCEHPHCHNPKWIFYPQPNFGGPNSRHLCSSMNHNTKWVHHSNPSWTTSFHPWTQSSHVGCRTRVLPLFPTRVVLVQQSW